MSFAPFARDEPFFLFFFGSRIAIGFPWDEGHMHRQKLLSGQRRGSFRMAGCAHLWEEERSRLTAACSGSGKVTLAAATSGRRSRRSAGEVWPTGARPTSVRRQSTTSVEVRRDSRSRLRDASHRGHKDASQPLCWRSPEAMDPQKKKKSCLFHSPDTADLAKKVQT